MFTRLFCLAPAISILLSSPLYAQDTPIIHDAQYYILEAQNREQWIEATLPSMRYWPNFGKAILATLPTSYPF